jgi:hypothetical protein
MEKLQPERNAMSKEERADREFDRQARKARSEKVVLDKAAALPAADQSTRANWIREVAGDIKDHRESPRG